MRRNSFRSLFSRSKLRYDRLDHVVLGLCNPGRRYAATPHNIGASVLSALARLEGIEFLPGRGDFLGGRLSGPGYEALLVLPTTFMNRSGLAGRQIAELTGLSAERILVVLDDLDLPLGRLRFRNGGSSGGHRGLESLIYEWQRSDFPRLRLGVGRPEGAEPADYLLEPFAAEVQAKVDRIVEIAAKAILFHLESGLVKAAGRFNALTIE